MAPAVSPRPRLEPNSIPKTSWLLSNDSTGTSATADGPSGSGGGGEGAGGGGGSEGGGNGGGGGGGGVGGGSSSGSSTVSPAAWKNWRTSSAMMEPKPDTLMISWLGRPRETTRMWPTLTRQSVVSTSSLVWPAAA